jgi:hypothetical protein
MKRPGFFEGVGVALAASVVGGVLFGALATVMAGGLVLRGLIAGIALLYLLYLLARSGEPVGRITTVAAWIVAEAGIWLLGLGLPHYLLAHLGLIWLVRSLYFHASLLSALADLALVLFGFAAAVWAAVETGSPFLGLWCFFLVQALFVAIPQRLPPRSAKAATPDAADRFQHAHRAAEAAITKLSSTH